LNWAYSPVGPAAIAELDAQSAAADKAALNAAVRRDFLIAFLSL
jgi:hypothetical protein